MTISIFSASLAYGCKYTLNHVIRQIISHFYLLLFTEIERKPPLFVSNPNFSDQVPSLADELLAVADIDRPWQNTLHAPTHQVVYCSGFIIGIFSLCQFNPYRRIVAIYHCAV